MCHPEPVEGRLMHNLLLAVLLAQAAPGIPSLDYFLGTWQCNGTFPSTGKTIASTMRFEHDLGGAAIVKHHDDAAPNVYHAIEAWNFEATPGLFNNAVADNFGGVRIFSSDGWHGDVLTWSSAAAVNPSQQFVYTRLSQTSMRVDWQVSRDGSHYIVGDTLTCTRNSAQ
jgi:hypothetical protein